MLSAKEKSLLEALEPTAREKGVEIVSIEIMRSKKGPIVRVYLETEGQDTFDVLTESQEWISAIMDELDPFPGAYWLEVSSPGIDRPLRTEEHFARFVGEKAAVSAKQPIDGRANWTGILAPMEDGCVVLDVNGELVRIPYDGIKRANVIGTVDFSK